MKETAVLKIEAAKFLKEGAEFLCAAVYWFFLPFISQKPRRVVLYYHGIDRRQMRGFERQMRYLAEHCVVTKAADIERINDNSGKIITAITFDDAFTSVAEYAAAILKKYGLPATIFVPTGWLGWQGRWMTDSTFSPDNGEAVMEKERIAELSGNGLEFCSHSVSHIPLSKLQGEQLENELTKSKDILENITGESVSAISYPYGEYNERVCDAARRAGYKTGFTIEPRIVDSSSDSLAIGRFKVEPEYSMAKFRLKVSGAYQVSIYLRRAKAMLTGKRFRGTESVEPVESYC